MYAIYSELVVAVVDEHEIVVEANDSAYVGFVAQDVFDELETHAYDYEVAGIVD
jgi:hypothetical protein